MEAASESAKNARRVPSISFVWGRITKLKKMCALNANMRVLNENYVQRVERGAPGKREHFIRFFGRGRSRKKGSFGSAGSDSPSSSSLCGSLPGKKTPIHHPFLLSPEKKRTDLGPFEREEEGAFVLCVR